MPTADTDGRVARRTGSRTGVYGGRGDPRRSRPDERPREPSGTDRTGARVPRRCRAVIERPVVELRVCPSHLSQLTPSPSPSRNQSYFRVTPLTYGPYLLASLKPDPVGVRVRASARDAALRRAAHRYWDGKHEIGDRSEQALSPVQRNATQYAWAGAGLHDDRKHVPRRLRRRDRHQVPRDRRRTCSAREPP